MTARMLALLALRILGVVLGLAVLSVVVQWISVRVYMSDPRMVDTGSSELLPGLANAVYVLCVGTVAWACLFSTDSVVRRFFPEFEDQEVAISGASLGPLAFRVLGMVVLAYAIPGIITGALEVLWHLGEDRQRYLADLLQSRWSTYVHWVASAGLGVFVFRRATRLAGGAAFANVNVSKPGPVREVDEGDG